MVSLTLRYWFGGLMFWRESSECSGELCRRIVSPILSCGHQPAIQDGCLRDILSIKKLIAKFIPHVIFTVFLSIYQNISWLTITMATSFNQV